MKTSPPVGFGWTSMLFAACAIVTLPAACAAPPVPPTVKATAPAQSVGVRPKSVEPAAPPLVTGVVPVGGGQLKPPGAVAVASSRAHEGFAAQLRDVAAIGYTRAVGSLLANSGSSVVSNNGSTLLAESTGSLVSNNAGSILANHASGVVSDHGANGVAAVGSGFRLAALAPPAFSLAPAGAELAPEELPNSDGTTTVYFDRPDGTQRFVVLNASRRPLEQGFVTQVLSDPDGTVRASHTERTLVYGHDQRRRGFLAYDLRYDTAGRLTQLTHAPSTIEGASGRLAITLQALTFTVEPAAGQFEIRFENLQAVEKGTINAVERNVGGTAVGVDLSDPLATLGGESRLETLDGRRLFDRHATHTGGEHQLVLTLRDGYALDLARATRTAPYRGAVTLDGVRIGDATLTTRADASISYAIAFDGDTPPITVNVPETPAAP